MLNTFNLIPLFIVLIIVLKIINNRLDAKQSKLQSEFAKEKLKYGLTSRYSLAQLTDFEFIDFCNEFLEEQGYENIKIISENIEGGITFIADKNKTSDIYVHCYKTISEDNSNTNDTYAHIGRPSLQKLVGAMVKSNIHNAVVITNGGISLEAIEYIKTLPEVYNIELLCGVKFSKACWNIRVNNIKKEVFQKS